MGVQLEMGRTVMDKWYKSSACVTADCVEVRFTSTVNQTVEVRDSEGRMLTFTADEWNAFIQGAYDGEFDNER